MTTNNQEDSELKQQFINIFEDLEQKVTACESEDLLFKNYENTKFFDDYSKALAKECTVLKAMDKLKDKLDRLDSQIEAYREKVQTEKKIDKLKQLYDDIEKKFMITKERSNEIDKISDFLGFQVDLKEEDVYTAIFTKLPIKDSEMKFKFDILENNNKLKVLRCDPPQCLDTADIETQVDQEMDDCSKFCKLILLIRHQLIEKYRN